jgi:hypothetical protein
MLKKSTAALLLFASLFANALAEPKPNGKAEHIVVLVWDGMRPDFITPQYCPNLYSLATSGTFFRRNHPVYISTTEVNGAAIATGASPGKNLIQANGDFRPELSFMGTYATEGLDAVRRGDLLTDGHYIGTPTVAETLQGAGIKTVTAGGKPVALFHDRFYRRESEASKQSPTLFEGKTIPRDLIESLTKVNDNKAFPAFAIPNKDQDEWTMKALTKSLWKEGVPKYTLLWLSEPDKSQHDSGVGAPNALAGIESSDNNLGEVIKTLKDKGVYDKTDIFVISDHGFSTISAGPDLPALLKKQKFKGGNKLEDPEPGDVITLGLGGSAMFYVVERQEAVVRRLVEFLQTTDFAGVIFSRKQPMDGTFPLEAVGYSSQSKNSPDVIMSFRWTATRNDYGAPGYIVSSGGTRNKGTHGSLSHYDMNNTLVAAGPDIKKGLISEVPSGNIDLAPTVLWLLGVPQITPMDGRVLHEALVPSKEAAPKVSVKKIEASRDIGLFRWKQYLQVSEVNGAFYYDEGNGEPVLKEPAK